MVIGANATSDRSLRNLLFQAHLLLLMKEYITGMLFEIIFTY